MADAFFPHNHEFFTIDYFVWEDGFTVDSIPYCSSDSSVQMPGPSNRSTFTDDIEQYHVVDDELILDELDVNDLAAVNSCFGLGLGLQDDHVCVFDEVDSRLSSPHDSDGLNGRVVNNAFDLQREVNVDETQVSTTDDIEQYYVFNTDDELILDELDVNDSDAVNSSFGLGLGLQDDHVPVFDEVDSRLSRPHDSDGFNRRVVNNVFDLLMEVNVDETQASTTRLVDPVDELRLSDHNFSRPDEERIGEQRISDWRVLLNQIEVIERELYSLNLRTDHYIDYTDNRRTRYHDHDHVLTDIYYRRARDHDQYDESFMFDTGRCPASKSVVEKLPWVVITEEDVVNEKAVCAVCTFQIEEGEKAKQLPCSHLYHGDCIFPWLRIRNTCPVCRYKLPTDES